MLILAIFIHQKRSTSVKVLILRIELILVELPVEGVAVAVPSFVLVLSFRCVECFIFFERNYLPL